jgi:methionyl-tRNA formyltransferase
VRTVFFGTPEIAVPCLAAVASAHSVAAAVCQPDKPKGRGKRLEAPPVKQWAETNGVPVHQPAKLNDGTFEAWLREQAPELCVVAAYGRILKQPILDVPPRGFINFHPSLLPEYRGPSPIQTALLDGKTRTGVTIMEVTLEMDAGPILLQREEAIDAEDTAGTLGDRLARMGGDMLLEAIGQLECEELRPRPQDDAEATYTTMFQKRDGRIRWENSAETIHNRVRACNPWPMAHCLLEGEVCRILKTRVEGGPASAAPGVVVSTEGGDITVAAGEGLLAIGEIQLAGKKPMNSEDFLRGKALEPGARFTDIPGP